MPQLIANTVLAAALIVLLGLGFSLIYRVGRFFHIAHGAVLTVGAYCLFSLVEKFNVSELVAIPLAVIASALIGGAIDAAIHSPLRRRQATPVVHLIASLGLYIATTNILALAFGDQTLSLRGQTVSEGLDVLGARLTQVQLATIAAAVLATVLAAAIVQRTNGGLRYRAVATNADLAAATGVPVDLVIAEAFVAGSAIAGIAGVCLALDVDARPTMGLGPLLLAVVAVVVGGAGSIRGLVVGAAIIATVQSVAGWYLGQHWREPVVFALLVVFLVARPRGLLGSPAMTGEN